MMTVVTPGTLKSRCHKGNFLPSLLNICNTLGKTISLLVDDPDDNMLN
jgi:hypothetical protein